jgi:hypothetical protein
MNVAGFPQLTAEVSNELMKLGVTHIPAHLKEWLEKRRISLRRIKRRDIQELAQVYAHREMRETAELAPRPRRPKPSPEKSTPKSAMPVNSERISLGEARSATVPAEVDGFGLGKLERRLFECLLDGNPLPLRTVINRVYKVFPCGAKLERYRLRLQKLKFEVNRKLEGRDPRRIQPPQKSYLQLQAWPAEERGQEPPPLPSQPSPKERCAAFILRLTTEGVDRSADLWKQCRVEGHSYRAYVEARAHLGVITILCFENGKQFWKLTVPASNLTTAET